jgi:uncharacterized protein YebE (UPF0316 family)
MITWAVLGNALLIFCLRLTDVSLGTVRMIMVTRGMRKMAALLGFVEVSIWVVAITRVLGNMDNVISVLAYAGGFACGTLLGMWIEERLALGHVRIRIISMEKGQEVAHSIREAGFGATLVQAEGQSGPVYMVDVVVARKEIQEINRLVNQVDAAAFMTVEDARRVLRGYQRLGK